MSKTCWDTKFLVSYSPDIAFAVSMVSQVMHSPYVERLDEVYRILKYLKETPRMGLFFKKNEIETLNCTHAD